MKFNPNFYCTHLILNFIKHHAVVLKMKNMNSHNLHTMHHFMKFVQRIREDI